MYNENGIEKVVAILMRREELSREDALRWVEEALEMVENAIAVGDDAEYVWENEVGLEPDYLFNILI